jgi:DNA polymerase I-like protein with 3'-5' exonuclease and polymerase domains
MNVIPVRPPQNHLYRLKSMHVDIKLEQQQARKIVEQCPRDLVICVGDLALETMTGLKGILKYRGSVLPGAGPRGVDVFPMIHPQFIYKDWKHAYPTRADMIKLKRLIDTPDYDDEKKVIQVYGKTITRSLRTRTEAPESTAHAIWINRLDKMIATAEAKPLAPVSFDIETFAGTVTVFGVSMSSNHALSIPFTGQFTESQEADLALRIAHLLNLPNPKITQNGIYDASYISAVWKMPVRGMVWDTMLMHHCIYSELPHSLAFLASVYTDVPFFKMMAKEADSANYDLAHWEYNALDVACTYQIYEQLRAELEHFDLLDFYLSYYVPLSRTLARIQKRGIKIEASKRDALAEQRNAELAQIREDIHHIAGQELNTNSPAQMKEFLYGTLQLLPQRHRVKKTITTDETALVALRRKYPAHKTFFNHVLDARDKQKMVSTYLKPVEDPDGRVRTSYNIAGNARKANSAGGTETGRLSSGENIFGRGTNMQNQPKWVRELYVPDEGYVFWQADLSAAESYFVGWDSGDPRMMQVLTDHRRYGEGKRDKLLYHENIGSIITGLGLDEIYGEIRDLAKRVGHGWNYGMGAGKLVEIVNNAMPNFPFSVREAKQCYQALDTSLSGVVEWRNRIRASVRSTRTLENPFGRKRIFMGRLEEKTYREAFAFLPQSSCADCLNIALIELEHLFGARSDIDIFGQVHDSVFGQCTPDVLDECRADVERVLERELPMERDGITLRVPCEFTHGANWKECG